MRWYAETNLPIFAYALWKIEDGVMELDSSLLSLFGESTVNNAKKLLAIEVLLDSKGELDDTRKQIIVSSLQNIKEKYGIGCIIFGISDDPSGSAALEVIANLLKNLPDRCTRVVSICRDNYLGHDPYREPDAGNGVNQSLLGDVDPNIWLQTVFPITTRSTWNLSAQPAHKEKPVRKHHEIRSSSLIISATILLFISWLIMK
eukprot:CAMPEP_0182428766 /NCGR_PEP_ID=MMETSP1167-20130531/23432_1 /TAXON_ID=2988 /ORGANISM="Mallomonas Sp, Strain CCMP3275" /LENGTH=202 /DNA_ID=CAMNT_0024611843 /DNA_START=279 /DNA_END=884 /DNA_ORIENTATION=+